MSHFTVLVIGDNPQQQLAPFQENNMNDCPREYLEFRDAEDEYREEYENDLNEWVKKPDGTLASKYNDEFYTPDRFDQAFVLPKGCELVTLPNKERFETFEQFMEEWMQEERDKETGRFGYWENPNKKWDWYQLGGRWTGFFKLKENAVGKLGRKGILTLEPKDGWVDQAYKRDIDFDGMVGEAAQRASKQYDEFEIAVRDVEPFTVTWDTFRSRFGNDIDTAREQYRSVPFIRVTRKLDFTGFGEDPVLKFKVLEDNPREAYIEAAKQSCFSTFAVLMNGKWYERGTMGWWAIVTNEQDKDVWREKVYELLDNASDDTLLSLYDCHI